MAFSTLLVLIFYSLEFFYKFKIPFLTHIGRNALFLFLFQGIFTITYPDLIGWNSAHVFRSQMASLLGVGDLMHPLVNLAGLIVFILPMLLMYLVAWLFDKFNIHIRV
jgi:hypothetical protein